MILELWERLRGYDKWPEATARMDRADMETRPHYDRSGNVSYTYTSSDQISWTDASSTRHSASFRVPESSPLYMLVDGNTVTIRYNPARPGHFYWRPLLQSRIATAVRGVLWTLCVFAAIALLLWLDTLNR
ncbi:MAG: DUF3592 domain-containing protein [Acidobacteriota bacterium]